MSSSLEMTEMYDQALLGILQHVGNIHDFLRVYFGFLYRKTDFYRLLSSPADKMGFPPGAAENMVFKTFKLFEKVAERDRERQLSDRERQLSERQLSERQLSELQKRDESPSVPPALHELEIAAEQTEEEEPSEEAAARTKSSSADVSAEATSEATGCLQPDGSGGGGVGGGGGGGVGPGQSAEGEQAAAADTESAGGAQEKFQSDPDSYNGAVRENYSWSQDYSDVEVRLLVPATVLKGRQVRVSLQPGGVKVCVRDGAEDQTLMDGEFTHKINTENSLWSLEPGRCVVLSLSKTSEVWWNAVLKGEKEIDINQINRERSMATVDEEEHAVLDRLTFDYHQKLQGKPQSHEMKVHDMLKKGWDAEGSPFRGQQFDPAMFDIPPGAVQF